MPKIHEREMLVRTAESDLRSAISKVSKEHDLTPAESLRVVTTVLGEHVQHYAKLAIRVERHGNEDEPGGWA